MNVRFPFDTSSPSVTQVLNRAQDVFRKLFQQRGVLRTFAVSAPVIFNDAACTWDRLERSVQLQHNCQVYLFQPDILDLPGEIPDPIDPFDVLGYSYHSPARETTSFSPRADFPSSYGPERVYSNFTTPHDRSLSFGQFSQNVTDVPTEKIGTSDGISIFKEERNKMDQLSKLPIDELRYQLRREAKEYSSSPDRR